MERLVIRHAGPGDEAIAFGSVGAGPAVVWLTPGRLGSNSGSC